MNMRLFISDLVNSGLLLKAKRVVTSAVMPESIKQHQEATKN